jgi:hypothetical protein
MNGHDPTVWCSRWLADIARRCLHVAAELSVADALDETPRRPATWRRQ